MTGTTCDRCGYLTPLTETVYLRPETRPIMLPDLEVLCGSCDAKDRGEREPRA